MYKRCMLLVIILSGCTPQTQSKLIASSPPNDWMKVAKIVWNEWYGQTWSIPPFVFTSGGVLTTDKNGKPCGGDGSFVGSTGACDIGETSYEWGLPDTEEIRVSTTRGNPYTTMAHELFHASLGGENCWGDGDPGHTNEAWKTLVIAVEKDLCERGYTASDGYCGLD